MWQKETLKLESSVKIAGSDKVWQVSAITSLKAILFGAEQAVVCEPDFMQRASSDMSLGNSISWVVLYVFGLCDVWFRATAPALCAEHLHEKTTNPQGLLGF